MSDTGDSEVFDEDASLVSGDFHFNTPPMPRVEHYNGWQCTACLTVQLRKKNNTFGTPSHCPNCGSTDLRRCVMHLDDEGCGPDPSTLTERLTSAAAENELKSGDDTSWVEDADGGFVTRESLSNHSGSTMGQTRHDSVLASPVKPQPDVEASNVAQEPAFDSYPLWTTVAKSPMKPQPQRKQASLFEKRQALVNTLKSFPPSGGPITYKEELQVLDVSQPLPLRLIVGGRYNLLLSDDVKGGSGSGSTSSEDCYPSLELPLRFKPPTRTPKYMDVNPDAETAEHDGIEKAPSRDPPGSGFKIRLSKASTIRMQRIRALSAKVRAMAGNDPVASPPEAEEVTFATPPQQTKSQKRVASTQVSPSIIKRLETEAARTTLLEQSLENTIWQQEQLVDHLGQLLIFFRDAVPSRPREAVALDQSGRGRRLERASPPTRVADEWTFTVSARVLRSSLEVMKHGKKKDRYKDKVMPRHIRFDAIGDGDYYVMSHDQ